MDAGYINANEHAYDFLVYYFLPELSETEFRPDAAEGDERFFASQYMAAVLPYEPHYTEIIRCICPAQKMYGDA